MGRALRKGEYKCKIHYLKLEDAASDDFDKMPVVCDWILRNGAEVGQTKREIIAHLSTIEPKFNITYETCRLRKKSYRAPLDIYTDNQQFGDDDIRLSDNFEVRLIN